jgi:hypothetical protein
MYQPTLLQLIYSYAISTVAHRWLLVVGVLMPLPDLYRHFHPKRKELFIPRWLVLTLGAGFLLLAQFLAYRDEAGNLAQVIEDKREFSIKINEQGVRLQNDEQEIADLKKRPDHLPSIGEPKNSLRRRVMQLAAELESLVREQNAVLPTQEESQAMTAEQKEAASRAFQEATKKTDTLYMSNFRSRTVGIIAELKSKGLLTEYWDGPLEKGAEFRMLGGGEIHRLQEVAYHLDGRDGVVRFYP